MVKFEQVADSVWLVKPVLATLIVLLLALLLVDWAVLQSRWIKGIPVVSSNAPVLGSLSLLYPPAKYWHNSPCLKFADLAKKYGDVYQVRLGSRLVVVANSYESIKTLWTGKNVHGNNSRPIGNTFHNVLSEEGIFTIGTTPFGEDYLKLRKFAASSVLSLNRNKHYNAAVISQEVDRLIERISGTSDEHTFHTELLRQCQFFHLSVALLLTYGCPSDFSDEETRKQAVEIITVENQITKVRSHVQNIQDFLPAPLRSLANIWLGKSEYSHNLFVRRKAYLDRYFQYARSHKADPTSEVRNSVMYKYFLSGGDNVKANQIASVCLTMVSAGLDNVPLNFKYELLQLGHSPQIVDKAYSELLKCYDNSPESAYKECFKELKCEYIVAIVKETLRLFTVLPLALPRETTAPISYGNAVIPTGTMLFLNCWAGNHDEKATYRPLEFIPERFVDNPDLAHLAFGVGSRMCLGNHLAFLELYVLTCKFILRFEVLKPTMSKLNPLALNLFPDSIAIEPEQFILALKERSV